jgi:glycosyltransferase involved in cell wall biosynthesis
MEHWMAEKLRINFVMPAAANVTGGPLAILEYANRLAARGHQVSVTTYPNSMWPGDNPYPWFKLNAEIRYFRDRDTPDVVVDRTLGRLPPVQQHAIANMLFESMLWPRLIDAMPECDLNIATLWTTAYPVYFSRKGKPVYFMQHNEEIFYPMQSETMMSRLWSRMSYALPIYKVANSSWLQRQIQERHGQSIPFSNNGIELKDFNPGPKRSDLDGIVRVVTYSRPDLWKGFPDAVAAMQRVMEQCGNLVEWHVFGYQHPELPEQNQYAPYIYHPKLPFSELAQLYASSDIALCPSWYESFPLPALEAMASGTSVVTTAFGTEDYAFHEQNALVVGSRDIEAMAASILRLVADPALRHRLAEAGRRTAEGFNWDKAVDDREQILLNIHRSQPGYDVERSAMLGLFDAHGISFERAPRDTIGEASGIYWDDSALYLLHGGVRRHVTEAPLVPELVRRGFTYLETDPLELARTPLGTPVRTVADLPATAGQSGHQK